MFSTVGYIVLAVVVVLVLASVSPPARRFFKSLVSFFGAKLDNATDQVSSADPLGQYKSKIKDAVENGRNAQKVVETAAQHLESLNHQIADELKEQSRLNSRIKVVLASGDPNKTADKYALDLERVERNLATNQDQLKLAQQAYDENLHLVESFETQIAATRKEADDLGFQLEQSKAEKDMYEVTASLKDSLNMGDLAESKKVLMNQIDANRGAAKALHDLGSQSSAEDADDNLERKERAQAILARFQPASNGTTSDVKASEVRPVSVGN